MHSMEEGMPEESKPNTCQLSLLKSESALATCDALMEKCRLRGFWAFLNPKNRTSQHRTATGELTSSSSLLP